MAKEDINIDSLAKEILETYIWDYQFGVRGAYAVAYNQDGDAWWYWSAEEVIGDFYEIMEDTYDDSIKNGNDGYWSKEQMEVAKECYEKLSKERR